MPWSFVDSGSTAYFTGATCAVHLTATVSCDDRDGCARAHSTRARQQHARPCSVLVLARTRPGRRTSTHNAHAGAHVQARARADTHVYTSAAQTPECKAGTLLGIGRCSECGPGRGGAGRGGEKRRRRGVSSPGPGGLGEGWGCLGMQPQHNALTTFDILLGIRVPQSLRPRPRAEALQSMTVQYAHA